MVTIIDSYVDQHRTLSKYLEDQGEISLKLEADSRFATIIVFACASYFEVEIVKIIKDYVKDATNDNEAIMSLLQKKVLFRQYHTLFDWDKKNANRFFSFFGEDSKDKHNEYLKKNTELVADEANFMFIGQSRNNLIHKNFADASIDQTYDEIYDKFRSANGFVKYVEQHLHELSS